eukprot:2699446-Rhodomonas_salina.6
MKPQEWDKDEGGKGECADLPTFATSRCAPSMSEPKSCVGWILSQGHSCLQEYKFIWRTLLNRGKLVH